MKKHITRVFAICEDVTYILLGVLLVAVAGLPVPTLVIDNRRTNPATGLQ